MNFEEIAIQTSKLRETTLSYLTILADADETSVRTMGYTSKEQGLTQIIANFRKEMHKLCKD